MSYYDNDFNFNRIYVFMFLCIYVDDYLCCIMSKLIGITKFSAENVVIKKNNLRNASEVYAESSINC